MFPPIVSAFALYLLYVELGKSGVQALDSFFGLTFCYVDLILPIVVWLMRDFFQNLPVAVEEAALVDNVLPSTTAPWFFRITHSIRILPCVKT